MKSEEVGCDYRPTGWRIYVIKDNTLGFFAGFTNTGAPGDVPTFCDTINGAVKYDAFRDLSARQLAEALRDRYVPNGKVLAYKRHEIFPEQYKKGTR